MYKKKIANIAKITNSTRIAHCSKTLLQMFAAILANIDLIEIACKNRKSNKKFHCTKKHPDNLSQKQQE